MSYPSGAVAIVGVAESDLGSVPDKTVLHLQAQAAARALADAGLTKADVDAHFTAGVSSMYGMQVAEYLGIRPRFTDSTAVGGSSFVIHVEHAAAAIAAGLCQVALITYGSTQRSDRSRRLGGRANPVERQTQFEVPYGPLLPIGAYAMAAHRHMHEYGTTSEQLAAIAVQTRQWAQLNPVAFMRDPLTVEDVLASPLVSSPLHLLDICLVTDGGGALVVTSAERAADLPKPPVYVLGSAEAHTHNGISQMPDLTRTPAAITGPLAFARAGLTPADVDVAELYDSFTITVLLTLEDLGFCPKGEGGAFAAEGRLGPGGTLPTNTNGGGLSYCHPGMYGIFTVIEAVRQLRGECGPRQVPNARIALCHGMGGVLSSSGTLLLGRERPARRRGGGA
jgi:acetyl-CoA acetyltransferase